MFKHCTGFVDVIFRCLKLKMQFSKIGFEMMCCGAAVAQWVEQVD